MIMMKTSILHVEQSWKRIEDTYDYPNVDTVLSMELKVNQAYGELNSTQIMANMELKCNQVYGELN